MAFEGIESPTDEQLVGAMMTAEYQRVMVTWGKAWAEWRDIWVKIQRSRRKKK